MLVDSPNRDLQRGDLKVSEVNGEWCLQVCINTNPLTWRRLAWLDTSGQLPASLLPSSGGVLPHTHVESEVTNLVLDLAAKASFGHAHAQTDVTGLDTAMAGKAALTHGHAQADVAGLVSALSAKQDASAKGIALGYASLDAAGKVPSAQLPTTGGGVLLGTVNLWKSDAVAAVANQGLNLPSALTELDSAVQGTRTILDAADVSQVQIVVTMRVIAALTGGTVTVSLRDTANTANVLASVGLAAVSVATVIGRSTWAAKPAWFTGTSTVGVYTSGGNATADFIFKDVQLRWKP